MVAHRLFAVVVISASAFGIAACSAEVAEVAPLEVADAAAGYADALPAPHPLLDAGHDAREAATPLPPDASKPDPVPPAAVVTCMDAKPYVEEKCVPVTVKGWPYPAQRCTYGSPIGALTVDVANPSASRVAIWILSAARAVPAVAQLEKSDPAHFLVAMQIMAVDVSYQSGRIFPLKGIIGEDMSGSHYIGYPFTDGVADNCPSGEPHAYCRINSLTRGMYCDYRGAHGLETVAACRARVGYAQGDTQAWYSECVGNHLASWSSPDNPHFVEKLWALLHGAGVTTASTGAQVVAALYSELGLKASDVASFCK